jgi:hypothetical protein
LILCKFLRNHDRCSVKVGCHLVFLLIEKIVLSLQFLSLLYL